MKPRNFWKYLRILLIILFIGLAGYNLAAIVLNERENDEAKSEYATLAKTMVKPETAPKTEGEEKPKQEEEDYPHLSIDFQALKYRNKDFVGWLSFPALDLSYPVCQEKKVDQYLYVTFDGKKNSSGCIFMDKDSSATFDGRSDFIFGHNMRNLSMFGSLKTLLRKGNEHLLEKNHYLYIYTEEKVIRYEIFAYYNAKAGSSIYSLVKTDEQYDAFLKMIEQRNVYKNHPTGDFGQRPEILTLSTCFGKAGGDTRFLVSAYKQKEWQNQSK